MARRFRGILARKKNNKMSSIKPLSLPDAQPPNSSWLENVCRWVPIVGWIIANEMEKRRYSFSLQLLARQLELRYELPANSDLIDSADSKLSVYIAKEVRKAFGWPNDHFVPDDPFSLMIIGDEGAGIEVFNAVEDYLELPRGIISNDKIEQFSHMTFKEVVESLLKLARTRE